MREEQEVFDMLISLHKTAAEMKERVDGLSIKDSDLKNDISWLSADMSDILSTIARIRDKQGSILLAKVGAKDERDTRDAANSRKQRIDALRDARDTIDSLKQRVESLEFKTSLLRTSTEGNRQRIILLENRRENRDAH